VHFLSPFELQIVLVTITISLQLCVLVARDATFRQYSLILGENNFASPRLFEVTKVVGLLLCSIIESCLRIARQLVRFHIFIAPAFMAIATGRAHRCPVFTLIALLSVDRLRV
jgi:hypothetical protein